MSSFSEFRQSQQTVRPGRSFAEFRQQGQPQARPEPAPLGVLTGDEPTIGPKNRSGWERAKDMFIGPGTFIGQQLGISGDRFDELPRGGSQAHTPVINMTQALPDNWVPESDAGKAVKGAVEGAAEFTSGLTSPTNLAIIAGTGIFGSIGKQFGKEAVQKLISLGFSADMVNNAMKQFPEVQRAWEQGDAQGFMRSLVHFAGSAGMGAVALKHGAGIGEKPAAPTVPRKYTENVDIVPPELPFPGQAERGPLRPPVKTPEAPPEPVLAESVPIRPPLKYQEVPAQPWQQRAPEFNREAALKSAGGAGKPAPLSLEVLEQATGQGRPVKSAAESATVLARGGPRERAAESAQVFERGGEVIPREEVLPPHKYRTFTEFLEKSKPASPDPAATPESAASKPQLVPVATGSRGIAYTTKETPVEFEYAVSEIGDLKTSFQEGYDSALQPRDISRKSSRERIEQRKADLNPEKMGAAVNAGDGAPITIGDGSVVTRNHGTQSLRELYTQGSPRAVAYRQWLVDNAAEFGLDPAAVAEMKAPVLHRRATGSFTPDSLATVAKEANLPTVAQYSEAEMGKVLGGQLTGHMMDVMQVNEAGRPSDQFTRALLAQLPVEVRSALEDNVGRLSQTGLRIIRNAVFAKAYPETAALERMAESLDSGVKNISNGMLAAAPRFAKLQEAIERRDAHDLGLGTEIAKAAETLNHIRESGQNVEQWLAQQDMFGRDPVVESLVETFSEFRRSGKRIGEILNDYVDLADATGSPKQQGMFGESFGVPSKLELVEAARERARARLAEEKASKQSSLFGEEGPPRDRGAGEVPGAEGQAQRATPGEQSGSVSSDLLGKASQALDDAANQALDRIRKSGAMDGSQLSGGVPVNVMTDMAIWGAAKMAKGTVDFTIWSREMVREIGPHVKEHLNALYEEAKKIYQRQIERTAGELPSTRKLLALYKKGQENQDWYAKTKSELEQTFGPDADLFVDLLAATSARNSVKGNVTLALKAYRQIKTGEPINGYTQSVAGNIERIMRGEELSGPKINSFRKALRGETESVTVDRWVGRAFGYGEKFSPQQYKFIDFYLTQLANRRGVEPRQMQAAIWAAKKNAEQMRENSSQPFEVLVRQSLERDPELARAIKAGFEAAKPYAEITRGAGERGSVGNKPEPEQLMDPAERRARDYMNLDRVRVSDAERTYLINEINASVDRYGLDPKQVEPHAEIVRQARMTNPDAALDIETGTNTRAARLAMRQRINSLAKESLGARRALEADRDTLTPEQIIERELALDGLENDLHAYIREWAGIRSADGRNLAMHKIMADSTWDFAYWYGRARRAMALPKDAELPESVRLKLTEILERGKKESGGNPEFVPEQLKLNLAKLMQELDRSGLAETISAVRKVGLLTGIKTHMRNIGGNTLFQVMDEVQRVPASILDMAMSVKSGERTVVGSNAKAVLKALNEARTRGLEEARQIIREGALPEDLAKAEMRHELNWQGPGGKVLNRYANFVFRTLAAEDRIFKVYIMRRSLEAQAKVLALNEARRGDIRDIDVSRRAKFLSKNPDARMANNAIEDANFGTFNNENWVSTGISALKGGFRSGAAKAAARMGTEGPIKAAEFAVAGLDWVMPFVRTPTNIIARVGDYSVSAPIKIIHHAAMAIAKDGLTPARQKAIADAFGRGLVGWGLILLGYHMAKEGKATGTGKIDASERNVNELTGAQSGSVMFGGGWHRVSSIAPFGNLVVMGADIAQKGGKPYDIIQSGAQTAMEVPMLKGPSEIIEVLQSPDREASEWAANAAGSMIPTMVSDIGIAVSAARGDSSRKEYPQTPLEGLRSRLPIARDTLPTKLNVLGKPVQGSWSAAVNPLLSQDDMAQQDFALGELRRLGVGLTKPKQAAGESEEVFKARMRLRGTLIERAIRRTTGDRRYAGAGDDVRAEKIKEAVRRAQNRLSAGLREPRYKSAPPEQRIRLLEQATTRLSQ